MYDMIVFIFYHISQKGVYIYVCMYIRTKIDGYWNDVESYEIHFYSFLLKNYKNNKAFPISQLVIRFVDQTASNKFTCSEYNTIIFISLTNELKK